MLNGIGRIYANLGYQKTALDYYERALRLFRATEDLSREAVVLNNIGMVYDALGNESQALNYFNQALPIRQTLDDQFGEAATLNNIGSIYNELGEREDALDYYSRSLRLIQAGGSQFIEAWAFNNIAYVYRDQGKLEAALEKINIAIAIIEKLRTLYSSEDLRASYFATVQSIYQLKTDLLMQLEREEEAFNTSEQSRARTLIELLAESNINPSQATNNPDLKVLYERKQELENQLTARESLIQNAQSDEIREQHRQEYQQLEAELNNIIELQIKQKDPAYAAIRYPTPLTLDQIQQNVLDDDTVLLQYAIGEQQSYLWVVPNDGELQSYTLPGRTDLEGGDGLASGFIEAVRNYECDWRQDECIPFGALSSGKALREQILPSKALNQLQRKRLLIVADGILQYVPFAALPDPNAADAEDYVPLIVSHEIVMAPSASSIAILREQVQRQEQNQQRLPLKTLATIADPVFSCGDPRAPQGCETILAPPSSGTESAVISVAAAPSLEAISLQLEQSALDRALQATDNSSTGLTRLNLTAETADRILETIPDAQRVRRVGLEASQNWVMGGNPSSTQSPTVETPLRPYQYVLFATHGIFDSQNPELSGLVLSQMDEMGQPVDGFLRLNEIFNLKLSADLVVLSACRSGLGENVRGEGLIGLTRGFMFAGAKRIMPTLWDISAEQPTDELLTAFFKKVLSEENSISPTTALRQAQLELWKKYRDPYYWAAFTIQGEWQE